MSQSAVKALGRRIKGLRQAQGVTQAQLAEACGYDSITISRFERGEYAPGIEALETIGSKLGVSIDAFFQAAPDGQSSPTELRHQICDAVYDIQNPKALLAILKTVRKIEAQ